MYRIILVYLFLFKVGVAHAQKEINPEEVLISHEKGKTEVYFNDQSVLCVNVNPKDLKKYIRLGYIQYDNLGAKGDGQTDDIDIIAATHAFANAQNLKVKANDKANYYISGKPRTAVIMTDTDFGTASFLIDDKKVKNTNLSVFKISSKLQTVKLKNVERLQKDQTKINFSVNKPCLITVTNSNVKQYIRKGLNQNNGSPQTDIFLVDKNGNVDPNTPILWNFDAITEITALQLDDEQLVVKGGNFTTIANNEDSDGSYFSRNIAVRRSNVLIEGIKHFIKGEGTKGAPYGGFINIGSCANVVVKDAVLTGHKVFTTIKFGKPVPKGTYDILATKALNISFINCSQTNDINDKKFWGIMASNFCKNIVYENCNLSRFDAHQGVANATIRNSTLGHAGINAIGSGKLIVENTTIQGRSLINLRSDYGSTWNGELIIKNCVFRPESGDSGSYPLINGNNSGDHDFGYVCFMPSKIIIENLKIEDLSFSGSKADFLIFANFNPKMVDNNFKEEFSYVKTEEIILNNVKIASGKELKLSNNTFMFKDVKVTRDN